MDEKSEMLSDVCQFVKQDKGRCKRRVSSGQSFCWQHAHGLRAKWRSLTKNQALGLSLVSVISLAATIGFGIVSVLPKSQPISKTQVWSSGESSPNVVDNQGKVSIQTAAPEKKPAQAKTAKKP